MKILTTLLILTSAHILYMHVNAMSLKHEREIAQEKLAVYEMFLGSLDEKIENMVVGMN